MTTGPTSPVSRSSHQQDHQFQGSLPASTRPKMTGSEPPPVEMSLNNNGGTPPVRTSPEHDREPAPTRMSPNDGRH